MMQSGYYSIGIDTAKNGDHAAVMVVCKDCNSVLLSESFKTDALLNVPKQCPNCNNETGGETATEISRRESVLIKRRAAQERAKREGYAPKEMSMTDISREFSSVFLDCIHPLQNEATREGSATT